MQPLNKEKIKQDNPDITDAEIDEYDGLSMRLYAAEIMPGELHVDRLDSKELDRYTELCHKIFPKPDPA